MYCVLCDIQDFGTKLIIVVTENGLLMYSLKISYKLIVLQTITIVQKIKIEYNLKEKDPNLHRILADFCIGNNWNKILEYPFL